MSASWIPPNSTSQDPNGARTDEDPFNLRPFYPALYTPATSATQPENDVLNPQTPLFALNHSEPTWSQTPPNSRPSAYFNMPEIVQDLPPVTYQQEAPVNTGVLYDVPYVQSTASTSMNVTLNSLSRSTYAVDALGAVRYASHWIAPQHANQPPAIPPAWNTNLMNLSGSDITTSSQQALQGSQYRLSASKIPNMNAAYQQQLASQYVGTQINTPQLQSGSQPPNRMQAQSDIANIRQHRMPRVGINTNPYLAVLKPPTSLAVGTQINTPQLQSGSEPPNRMQAQSDIANIRQHLMPRAGERFGPYPKSATSLAVGTQINTPQLQSGSKPLDRMQAQSYIDNVRQRRMPRAGQQSGSQPPDRMQAQSDIANIRQHPMPRAGINTNPYLARYDSSFLGVRKRKTFNFPNSLARNVLHGLGRFDLIQNINNSHNVKRVPVVPQPTGSLPVSQNPEAALDVESTAINRSLAPLSRLGAINNQQDLSKQGPRTALSNPDVPTLFPRPDQKTKSPLNALVGLQSSASGAERVDSAQERLVPKIACTEGIITAQDEHLQKSQHLGAAMGEDFASDERHRSSTKSTSGPYLPEPDALSVTPMRHSNLSLPNQKISLDLVPEGSSRTTTTYQNSSADERGRSPGLISRNSTPPVSVKKKSPGTRGSPILVLSGGSTPTAKASLFLSSDSEAEDVTSSIRRNSSNVPVGYTLLKQGRKKEHEESPGNMENVLNREGHAPGRRQTVSASRASQRSSYFHKARPRPYVDLTLPPNAPKRVPHSKRPIIGGREPKRQSVLLNCRWHDCQASLISVSALTKHIWIEHKLDLSPEIHCLWGRCFEIFTVFDDVVQHVLSFHVQQAYTTAEYNSDLLIVLDQFKGVVDISKHRPLIPLRAMEATFKLDTSLVIWKALPVVAHSRVLHMPNASRVDHNPTLGGAPEGVILRPRLTPQYTS